MIQTGLDYIRERGGKIVLLEVMASNIPVRNLYERLGFEQFADKVVFEYRQTTPPRQLDLPQNYSVSLGKSMNWRDDYELALRSTPADVQKYEPVNKNSFRSTLTERLLAHVMRRIEGLKRESVVVSTISKGGIVAKAGYLARTQPGGINYIYMRIDPAHAAELAPYLLHDLIRTTQQVSPGRRIVFTVPNWQKAVIEAARAAGCKQRRVYHEMGLIL